MYHIEHYIYTTTLCGLSYDPGSPEIGLLYKSSNKYWMINKSLYRNTDVHFQDVVENTTKNMCVTCLLIYSDDNSLALHFYKNVSF